MVADVGRLRMIGSPLMVKPWARSSSRTSVTGMPWLFTPSPDTSDPPQPAIAAAREQRRREGQRARDRRAISAPIGRAPDLVRHRLGARGTVDQTPRHDD